ncbi:MAG TPA: zinc-binding alcohol dehydrogenase [Woeseiaceae bacterium]|nr:zinc-binding alcohol dehydrogenase [Woeseiaceae bacterium]
MSIGTETTILHEKYSPGTHFDRIFAFPQLKTGVQALGVVEELGADVDEFAVGDTIFMRMAHGSHQVLPAALCSAVPNGIDPKHACWCGLAKTAFRAAWAADFASQNHVLIVGAGPVGQMATRWASAEHVAQIGVADLSDNRLRHAENGGANLTYAGNITDEAAPFRSMNIGNGPAIVVDTTGNPAVFQHVLNVAGKFGKLILLGDTGYPERQCLTSDMMTKGLTVQATHDSHDRDGWTQRKIDERFFDHVGAGRFNLNGLITHEFAPADCREAYALAERHRETALGILFDWSETG